MANYLLDQTGAGVQEAINKALSPDTTPTAGSAALITSGAVAAALANLIARFFYLVTEDGWHLVDEQMNVAMKYDADGLDVAKVSDHFRSLIGGGGGSVSGFSEVVEDGLYFVDESLRIGAFLDSEGLHAVNILEYEIVNS